MALCSGNQVGKKVCEILGISPKNVKKIEVNIAVNEVVYAVVTRHVEVDELNKIMEEVSESVIVEKKA